MHHALFLWKRTILLNENLDTQVTHPLQNLKWTTRCTIHPFQLQTGLHIRESHMEVRRPAGSSHVKPIPVRSRDQDFHQSTLSQNIPKEQTRPGDKPVAKSTHSTTGQSNGPNKKDSRPEWVVGIDPSPHKLCNLNHISKIVGSIYPNFVGHTYVQFEVCIPGTCYIKYHLVNCYIAIPVRIW